MSTGSLHHRRGQLPSLVSLEEAYPIANCNTHVKLEISEGRGASVKKGIEDYRVLTIYTKTYNKWLPCEVGKQIWRKGIARGKYPVLLRMVQYDHLMGKYKHASPLGFSKWSRKSMFVLCDASAINEVVQMLGTE